MMTSTLLQSLTSLYQIQNKNNTDKCLVNTQKKCKCLDTSCFVQQKRKIFVHTAQDFFSPNKIAKDVNDDISYLEVTEGDSQEKRKKKECQKTKQRSNKRENLTKKYQRRKKIQYLEFHERSTIPFLLLFEIVSLKLVKYLCELNLNQFPQNQSRQKFPNTKLFLFLDFSFNYFSNNQTENNKKIHQGSLLPNICEIR